MPSDQPLIQKTDQFGKYVEITIGSALQCFRWINGGRFLMGSPEDEPNRCLDELQHEVDVDGYWLADTVCTQEMLVSVMGELAEYGLDFPNKPASNSSWNNAMSFINKLNEKQSDFQFRLPTEEEWEYACRAGATTAFSFGKNITMKQVNYFHSEPLPVKKFPPNAWGLYEMHGNVWEWCSSIYSSYDGNSLGYPDGLRVMRGGCWGNKKRFSRSAYRSGRKPDFPPADIENDYLSSYGFRLVVSFN